MMQNPFPFMGSIVVKIYFALGDFENIENNDEMHIL